MDYQAIVIGGGPAGAAAARQLARRQRRVLLIERRRFPRFQIGESMLPASNAVFRQLGLEDVVAASVLNRLRLELFFAVVAAQRFLPLAPRSHSAQPAGETGSGAC